MQKVANFCEPPTVPVGGPEDLPCSYGCPFALSEGHRKWRLGIVSSSRGGGWHEYHGARCCAASAGSGGLARPGSWGEMPSDSPESLPRVPPTAPSQAVKGAEAETDPLQEAPAQPPAICSRCPLGPCWQPHYRYPREAVSTATQSLMWDLAGERVGLREEGQERNSRMLHVGLPQFPFVPRLAPFQLQSSLPLTPFKLTPSSLPPPWLSCHRSAEPSLGCLLTELSPHARKWSPSIHLAVYSTLWTHH